MSELQQFPLVSVVLTTYNGEKFLAQQIDSILKQTYVNIEIIAVDDCSTDHSVVILNSFADEHKNIKVVVNETNLGVIKNFEKGCGLARGEFIAFCDQDDYWLENKIQRLMESIGDYSMIYCDSMLCDEDLNETGNKISDYVVCKQWNNCLQLTVICRIYGHTILIKKELLQYAMPFLPFIAHDWWLPFIATLHGGITYLAEPLTRYRQHSANIYGAIGAKRKKDTRHIKLQKNRLKKERIQIRGRMNVFYQVLPDHLVKEKNIILALLNSYRSFSLLNNISRVHLFFIHYQLFLAPKKRSIFRNWLFCLKQ